MHEQQALHTHSHHHPPPTEHNAKPKRLLACCAVSEALVKQSLCLTQCRPQHHLRQESCRWEQVAELEVVLG